MYSQHIDDLQHSKTRIINLIKQQDKDFIDYQINGVLTRIQNHLNYALSVLVMEHERKNSKINTIEKYRAIVHECWAMMFQIYHALKDTKYTDYIEPVGNVVWLQYDKTVQAENIYKEYEYVSCLISANWI